MKIQHLCLGLFACTVGAVPTTGSSDVTDTWASTSRGNWSTTTNWSLGQAPGPTTNVVLLGVATSGLAYTSTNDIVNLTINDLTAARPAGSAGAGTIGILLNASGFDVNGTALIGQGGVLTLNGFSMLVGGFLQTTNGGAITLSPNNSQLNAANGFWNGGSLNLLAASLSTNIVNVGGTDQLSAMGSLAVLTNAAGGTITIGNGSSVANQGVTDLNASTNLVGFVNNGKITTANAYGTLNINALFLNDVTGVISPTTAGQPTDVINIWGMQTNRGTINTAGAGGAKLVVEILNGDVVNQGSITSAAFGGAFQTQAGTLLNDTNGTILITTTQGLLAPTIVNRGTLVVSNADTIAGSHAALTLANALTNEAGGNIVLSRLTANGANLSIMAVSNVVNSGSMTAAGRFDVLTNAMALIQFSGFTAVTNLASGVFSVTNGGAAGVAVAQFYNAGTIQVASNSTFGVGFGSVGLTTPAGGGAGTTNSLVLTMTLGTTNYLNNGTISLSGGAFGATSLTNAATAVVSGYGDVGRITFTNLVLLGVTNFSRVVEAGAIINSGRIAPIGLFNAGAISNLAGGSIAGSGVIESLNVTNKDDGSSSFANAGRAVFNAAGASVFASGSTLVLSNGFYNNLNAGTIGTTNGGTLQLGDGTLSLTSSGTLSLDGGALALGNFVNAGLVRGNGTVQSTSVTNSGTISPGNSPGILTFSSNLTLLASSVLNMELGGTNAASYDRIVVNGHLAIDGTLTITDLSPFTPSAGDSFDLFDFSGPLTGTFSATNLPSLGGGLAWDFSQFNSQGILSVTSAIPEPSSSALLVLGGLAAAALVPGRRGRHG